MKYGGGNNDYHESGEETNFKFPIVDQYMYLGVDISKYCSWDTHIAKVWSIGKGKTHVRQMDPILTDSHLGQLFVPLCPFFPFPFFPLFPSFFFLRLPLSMSLYLLFCFLLPAFSLLCFIVFLFLFVFCLVLFFFPGVLGSGVSLFVFGYCLCSTPLA